MRVFARLLPWFAILALGTALSAAPKRLVVFPGDHNSVPAVAAVKALRTDPQLLDLAIHVYPNIGVDDGALAELRRADLVILDLMTDPGLMEKIGPELRLLKTRGVATLGVGEGFSADLDSYGIVKSPQLYPYRSAASKDAYLQLIRRALADTLYPGLTYAAPIRPPDTGYYAVARDRIYPTYEEFLADYRHDYPDTDSRPWVGIIFPRNSATLGQTETLRACDDALRHRGFNVVALFGYPDAPTIDKLLFDAAGKPRVEALVAFTIKMGLSPDKIIPVLSRLDAPVVNAISLYGMDRATWEASPTGLPAFERAFQIVAPEIAGAIAPTVIASKEKVRDPDTGLVYASTQPIPERVERLADRIAAWVRLRHLPASQKKIAVIYYNYPPGRDNVGAAYLNVLPESLWQILGRLRDDRFDTTGSPDSPKALFSAVRDFGSNGRAGDLADLDRLVRGGHAVLWPVAAYRKYFDALPAELRDSIVAKWGQPETSRTMVWHDKEGRPFFVFPVLRWGNVLYAPQPTRGWGEDVSAMYHDLKLPLHHQYLAFYLWLQHEFAADAMVHVGTHATHEWQSGKEVGFTAADPGEVLVGAVPQLYPYIVDNIGEGQQAKRRGMAAIITHMTPPLDKASLNPELREIAGLINDLNVAREKGAQIADDLRREIGRRAAQRGLLKDLAIELAHDQLLDHGQIEAVEHHIKRIGEKIAPFGLHTFGVAPEPRWQEATADAILSIETSLSAEERTRRHADYVARIQQSARKELDALSAGLAGRYIPAGPGNDPIRNPNSLPTGKDFYGFDPSRLPAPAAYEAGKRLADQLIADYRAKHDGEYPDRLVINLWATETNRHEGVMEAQVLALLGVRPRWDERGRVDGIVIVPRDQLDRPRVDVTVTPTGLYRDSFPVLMLLIDKAVDLVRKLEEADNPIRLHVAETTALLRARGLSAEDAERVAAVRIFTEPPGVYGAGLENVISADKTWTNEAQVADVYFNRLGHMFGQGFWGARTAGDGTDPDLATTVFKEALRGTKGVIHSRSSNIFATLDNDDVFQYLGGVAMAVRQVDGKTPAVLISDLSDPREGKTVAFEQFVGEEMRSRYLNPKWVKEMLDEGYAGARFVKQVTDNLWGWQVTVPEAIDGTKWQEMYEVYVKDRYQLDVRKKFEAAGNLRAYQAMVDRMLVAVDKGYWKAAPDTVQGLREASALAAKEITAEEAVEKVALANAPLPDTAKLLAPAPAVIPAPAPAPAVAPTQAQAQAAPKPSAPPPLASAQPPPPASAKPQAAAKPSAEPTKSAPAKQPAQVQGKVLEEVAPQKKPSASGASAAHIALGAFAGLAAVFALFAFGWWRQGRGNSSR